MQSHVKFLNEVAQYNITSYSFSFLVTDRTSGFVTPALSLHASLYYGYVKITCISSLSVWVANTVQRTWGVISDHMSPSRSSYRKLQIVHCIAAAGNMLKNCYCVTNSFLPHINLTKLTSPVCSETSLRKGRSEKVFQVSIKKNIFATFTFLLWPHRNVSFRCFHNETISSILVLHEEGKRWEEMDSDKIFHSPGSTSVIRVALAQLTRPLFVEKP